MTRLFEAKPFIIAEVGSNWQTLDDCLESIRIAAECGADAVKFQAFSRKALFGFESGLPPMDHELPLEWLPQLKSKADECSIEFMCTAFSPELVAAVDPFVSVHKVASSDAAWPQMLEAVARTGKPVLVSLGAKAQGDIDQTVEYLELMIGTDEHLELMEADVVLMHCVAAYPADCIDLSEVEASEGFSDHSLGYTAAVHAAKQGAIVIEKHFTAFPELDTPDRPHSLTPTQFKRMVDIIRGREVESEETAMFLRHNRRLIATRDVGVGETLRYGENFGAYRSLVDDTRGLSPFDWEKVEGRKAAKPILRGAAIGLGDYT